jgi:Protein of unknown function (DUF2917)
MNIALELFSFAPALRRRQDRPSPAAWLLPTRQPTQTIDKGATLVVAQPLGATVTCGNGSLWITHDGDVRDVVISAGESHTCDRASRMLVFGLETSSVHVT